MLLTEGLMISYQPFWATIKAKGITTYALINKMGIANGTLYRMRKGRPISTETINSPCRAVGCRIEDIAVYIEDEQE